MDEEQSFEEGRDFWEYPGNTADSHTTRKAANSKATVPWDLKEPPLSTYLVTEDSLIVPHIFLHC